MIFIDNLCELKPVIVMITTVCIPNKPVKIRKRAVMNFWIGLAHFLAAILLQLFLVECTSYASSPHNNFLKKYTDQISNNDLIGTHQTTARNCARLCARKPDCVGYNIGPLNLEKNTVRSCW